MLKFPIYLDYSATTPVDPRVAAKMIPYLTEHFGNPASRSHAYGWEAERAVEEAREQVAALVNADAKEIIWTSGATESNNLAIKGAAHFYSGKGKHLITVKTEHKAVLDTTRELERQGFEVTYLDVQDNGLIDLETFKAALRPDTIVVSSRSPRLARFAASAGSSSMSTRRRRPEKSRSILKNSRST
jgi:cysteine desulfurase